MRIVDIVFLALIITLLLSQVIGLYVVGRSAVAYVLFLAERRKRHGIPLALTLIKVRDRKLPLPTTPPQRCITKRSRTGTAKGDQGRPVAGSGSS